MRSERFVNQIVFSGMILIFVAAAVSGRETGDPACLSPERIREALRSSKVLVVMRHAKKKGGGCGKEGFADCKCVGNSLLEKGGDQARWIKDAIDRGGIEVGEVHVSPYCRTLETGLLAFGSATVEAVLGEDKASGAGYSRELLEQIKEWSMSDGLTVVVTHSPNLKDLGDATGWGPLKRGLDEGWAVVAQLDGRDLRLIGCLKPEDWCESTQSPCPTDSEGD